MRRGPAFRAAPVRVRVPATSANLGPGFDSAGLALSLYDEVVVRVAESGLVVDVAGEGADTLARDRRHLVVKALRAAFDALGGQPRGLEVVCANRIPQSRGLGSSAAAIVAGLVAARSLVLGGEETLDVGQTLALAAAMEGHPDNVAACLLGGLTLAWAEPGQPVQAARFPTSAAVVPVACVPATRSSTAKVRRLLPEAVPFADAAANAGRAALLVTALTERPALLMAATRDLLHEQYRAPAMPRTAGLVGRLRGAGIPAVVSGAGPSVLALTDGRARQQIEACAPRGWTVLPLTVDLEGAVVRSLPG
ncbi:MAG: homoserine kinase [Actinomycetota bacterium]|nr:homoserine kinase [Actinomycetota bacterium]